MSAALKLRAKAGGIHLLISFTVAALALLWIYRVWYPDVLAEVQGVSHIVLIMLGVDVVLGPLLTTVVFRAGKTPRALRFDLVVIGLAQLTALVYGLHTVAQGRPAYLVFNIDRFDAVAVSDLDTASLQRALAAGGQRVSMLGPQTVAARLPADPAERARLQDESLQGGSDLSQRPEWYLPYEDDRSTVMRAGLPMDRLRRQNDLGEAAWTALLRRYGGNAEALRCLPLVGKERDAAVIIDAATGDVLGFELLQPPWKRG